LKRTSSFHNLAHNYLASFSLISIPPPLSIYCPPLFLFFLFVVTYFSLLILWPLKSRCTLVFFSFCFFFLGSYYSNTECMGFYLSKNLRMHLTTSIAARVFKGMSWSLLAWSVICKKPAQICLRFSHRIA
jgi:hypothetical protein